MNYFVFKQLKKFLFASLLFVMNEKSSSAQNLEYLPPLINAEKNMDTSVLLVNTLDFARFDHVKEKIPYVHSIQIVDANKPWPPIWYLAKPVYTDEMYLQDSANHTRLYMNFIENPEIQDSFIFYLQIYPLNKFYNPNKTFDVQHNAFLAVLNKNLDFVDSINLGRFRNGSYSNGNYRYNKGIEIVTMQRMDTVIDCRKVSGNERDSNVDCEYGIIKVTDFKDSVIFVWNPLEHIDNNIFNLKEKLQKLDHNNKFHDARWLKLSSVNWDYDGNILFAIEDVCIGKISRIDGQLIWCFSYMNKPVLLGNDSFMCYSPYDFRFLRDNGKTATYVYYERGKYNILNARGVYFEQDKKTLEVKSLKYFKPKEQSYSMGHGGFDYYTSGNPSYIIDYGIWNHLEIGEKKYWSAFEYGINENKSYIYKIPVANYTFGVHKYDKLPVPIRPTIENKDGLLRANGVGKIFTWYKIFNDINDDNIYLKEVGRNQPIKPEKGYVYCVASPYGCGYIVSKEYKVEEFNQKR